MSHIIIGTCGHVDHGKTALIRALNGFEGDTLKEERARGITIDLSFSNLSNGERNIAFIDVPGHEKLVKHMISGAFGFDAVLVVVSAAEGIKPQTVEHLEILKLLGVTKAVLAISKKDLLDQELLEKRREEIRQGVAQYGFDIEETLVVSIYDETSIGRLKKSLFALESTPKTAANFFRMYVDRVFSLKGAGTVVTGTVLGDAVSKEEKLFVCDTGSTCKIKNMQVHGRDVEKAEISNRVAVNLGGVDAKEIQKGFLLSKKGYLRGFKEIDISFDTIGKQLLGHNKNYSIYIGAKHFEAKVILFGSIGAEAKGFATLKADRKIFSIYGEKLIIRHENRTVGGAVVVNPVADPLRKSQKQKLLEALEKRDFKLAYTLLLEAHRHGLGLVSSAQRFALSHEAALQEAKALENVFVDEKALTLYPLETQKEIVEVIRKIYEKNPYALLSTASLKLRLPWAGSALVSSAFEILLKEEFLTLEQNLYRSGQRKEDLTAVLEERILKRLEGEGFSPSAPNTIFDELDLDRKYGEKILKTLCRRKHLVRLAHNLFISADNLEKIVEEMRKIIAEEGFINIGNFRERHTLSRKYLVAYLEYLDGFSEIGKEGNNRKYV